MPIDERIKVFQINPRHLPPTGVVLIRGEHVANLGQTCLKEGAGRVFDIRSRFTLAATAGVLAGRLPQLVANADVIDNQAMRFVAENAINTRNGLDHVVTLHRLIDVERMQAWNVRPRQPHIANDYDLKWVVDVLHPLLESFSLGGCRVVALFTPLGWIVSEVG